MMANALRIAREDSANVAYMAFIRHIRADKEGLFCFFEGKDGPYYTPRVKQVFKGNCYPVICAGKGKVLKVFELVNAHIEYEKYLCAYFIDKDFDPPLNDLRIYETPCYSIENLYVDPNVFGEIIKNELGLSEIDEDFERCVGRYLFLQNDFHEAVTLFNAWYACLIDERNVNQMFTGVNLEDTIHKDFLSISIQGIFADYNLTKIYEKYPNAIKVSPEQINKKIENFSNQNKWLVFRGKFELSFMLKILDDLIADSKTTKSYITKPIKYHTTHTQAISQFSQYAITPPELLEYIQSICVDKPV